MMEKKKIIIISMILSGIFLLIGTLAWMTWKSRETALVLTVGDIDKAQVVLKPYQIDSEIIPVLTYEEEQHINVEAINNSNDIKMIKLFYQIDEIDSELISENFKYTITKSVDGGNTYYEYLSGNFSEAILNDNFYIMEEQVLSNRNYKYQVYLWLDGSSGSQGDITGKQFKGELRADIIDVKTYQDSILNGADPVLDDGMIPIIYGVSGKVLTADMTSKWYDYRNKEWANAVLVKERGTNTRAYYQSNIGVEIPEEDILAYYVYIPRYKYKIWTTELSSSGKEQEIDIVFENKNTPKSTGTVVGEYLTHPAFTFGTDELNGIWFGKFELTGTASEPTIKPSVLSLRNQTMADSFNTIKKIEDNYGLGSNADSHMTKNVEWGAAAYLSQSKYGRCTNGSCEEIRRNNNSGFYTGYSEVNVATTGWSEISSSTNEFGTSSSVTQPYNTEVGYLASTTGNIYGIYDMSGGNWDRTMGVLADQSGNPRSGYTTTYNSGFNGMLSDGSMYTSGINFPDRKYYDLYTSADTSSSDISLSLTACNGGICFGHGLSETNGWHNDYVAFISIASTWTFRGGYFCDGFSTGPFYSSYTYGESYNITGSRAVLSIIN